MHDLPDNLEIMTSTCDEDLHDEEDDKIGPDPLEGVDPYCATPATTTCSTKSTPGQISFTPFAQFANRVQVTDPDYGLRLERIRN